MIHQLRPRADRTPLQTSENVSGPDPQLGISPLRMLPYRKNQISLQLGVLYQGND